MTTNPRLRAAGLLEKYSTTRHALGLYNNVACTAVFSSDKAPRDLKTLVLHAMSIMIQIHPSLSVLPVDEDKSDTYFARLPKVDLLRAITFTQTQEALLETGPTLDTLLERQHNLDFKSDYGQLPFWRLLITQSRDQCQFAASFIYAHSIGDGLSGLAFHRTLRAALDQAESTPLSSTPESFAFVTAPDVPLLPNLEALHPLPISLWYILATLWQGWFPPKLNLLWSGRTVKINAAQRKVRIRTLRIPAETVKKILSESRTHGASLTSTMEVMLAAAIFECTSSDECQVLAGNSPISLRAFLPKDIASADSMGVWVSSYSHIQRRPQAGPLTDEFWAEAKNIKQTINREVAKAGKDTPTALLRWAGDLKEFFLKKDNQPRAFSLECSNLGSFKCVDNESGNWKVGGVLFSQDVSPTGAAINTSLVTGADGCLSIAFSWLDEAVDATLVERVIMSFRRISEQFV